MNIKFNRFGGLVPRQNKINGDIAFASKAIDVDLADGYIRPIRTNTKVMDLLDDTKTVYRTGCCWVQFPKCVDATDGFADCERLYVTGLEEYPVTGTVDKDCVFNYCRLGVPSPSVQPLVNRITPLIEPKTTANNAGCSFGGDTNCDVSGMNNNPAENTVPTREERVYLFTYVNKFCEEGAPSYPSTRITVDDGSVVEVFNFPTPPPEYCITHIRIYRSVTPISLTEGNQGEYETVWELVDQVPVGTTIYVDSKLNKDLGEVLRSQRFHEPPVNLKGIMRIKSTNVLVGYFGNRLAFSENMFFHAFPEEYQLVLDSTIRGVGQFQDKLLVVTKNNIYIVEALQGCEAGPCRQVQQILVDTPYIRCCDHRGIINTDIGVFFTSHDGVYFFDGNTVTNATVGLFGRDEWHKLYPDQYILGYDGFKLYMFSPQRSFAMTIMGKQLSLDTDTVVELTDKPKQVLSGRLMYLVQDKVLSSFANGNAYRTYQWESWNILTPSRIKTNSANVRAEGFVTLGWSTDGRVLDSFTVRPRTNQRIQQNSKHDLYKLLLKGTGVVYNAVIATSFEELSDV